MSVLFLDPDNAHVIDEPGFVPTDDGRSVFGYDPQISGTVLHLRRFLVHLQLIAISAGVSGRTRVLAALGRDYSFHSALDVVESCPREHQPLVEHRFGSAVPHLFLHFVRDVERASPDLHLVQLTLETGFRERFSVRPRFA